jgi:hypothetical protein
MTALRQQILDRARAGESDALDALDRIIGANIPAREIVRQRDERLYSIAVRLAADGLARGQRHGARIIHVAGLRLSTPRGQLSNNNPFQRLQSDELEWLAQEIREIFSWSPQMIERWPSVGSIRRIIQKVEWPILPPLK